MANPDLIKTYVAETAVAPYRIVKFGSTDGSVVQASVSTDSLMGINGMIQGDAGKRVDIIHDDIAEVESGGTITRGDWLTSDANGKAVTAAPAAGTNANVIGKAMVSAVAGDIFNCLIAPCRIQG